MQKERLNILVICNEIFFNSFSIFVGRLLGQTDLLSFNDEIKLMVSFELVSFRKKEFPLACWRNSSNNLFENLIFCFSFFCYCAEVIIKNVDNFLRVSVCFTVLSKKMNIWCRRLFPGYHTSDSFPSVFNFFVCVIFKELAVLVFFTFLDYS